MIKFNYTLLLIALISCANNMVCMNSRQDADFLAEKEKGLARHPLPKKTGLSKEEWKAEKVLEEEAKKANGKLAKRARRELEETTREDLLKTHVKPQDQHLGDQPRTELVKTSSTDASKASQSSSASDANTDLRTPQLPKEPVTVSNSFINKKMALFSFIGAGLAYLGYKYVTAPQEPQLEIEEIEIVIDEEPTV